MKSKLLSGTLFVLLVVVPVALLVLCSYVIYQDSTFKEATATYVSTSDKVKKISESTATYDQTNYQTRYEYTHNYVYKVDGKEYHLKKVSSFNEPEKEIIVKYNPNNPNDTMTGNPWILFGAGLLLSIVMLSVYIYNFCNIKWFNNFIDKINVFKNFSTEKALFVFFISIAIISSVLLLRNAYVLMRYKETDLIYVQTKTYKLTGSSNKELYDHDFYYMVDDNSYPFKVKETEKSKDKFKTIRYLPSNPKEAIEGSKVWNLVGLTSFGIALYFSIAIARDMNKNISEKKGKK